MRIYAIGCSFTYGDELLDPAATAWPAVLSKKLNASVVNDAVCGGTNSRTVYRTIKNLQNEFDLYIVAWTSNTRFTFYKSDNNFEINFNPQLSNSLYEKESFYQDWGQILYSTWYNELYSFKLWLQQIIQLQAVIKKPCLMINTTNNNMNKWLVARDQFIDSVKSLVNFDLMTDEQLFDEYNEIQYYLSLIDTSMFYNWKEFNIVQLCSRFPCGPGNHILEEGHATLADLIYRHLCSK